MNQFMAFVHFCHLVTFLLRHNHRKGRDSDDTKPFLSHMYSTSRDVCTQIHAITQTGNSMEPLLRQSTVILFTEVNPAALDLGPSGKQAIG